MTPWREYKKKKKYPKLQHDLSVDVAIIGGGMAGVLNAYALNQAGKSVILLEQNELGSYATMDTTAFITKVIDSNLAQIVSLFGDKIAKSVWQSGQEAIEEFDRIIEKEKIECEFKRCSNYLFASRPKQLKDLEEDYPLYQRFKLGAAFHKRGNDLGFTHYGLIEVFDQAKFHPTKFLYSLAERASDRGALIFEHTEALEIAGDGPVMIETRGGTITAEDVIIATYKPLTNKKTHLKKAMYRSYVFEAEIPKGKFKEALYEDMGNPYYYFRIDNDPSTSSGQARMIIGGEDHKDIFGDKLAKKSFESLDKFLHKLMAGGRYWLVKKWNGPILEPTDGLPLIGRIKPHYYVATGFSGNGMTYSMISSMLLRDLILGEKNAWAAAYDPTRTLLHPKRLGSKAKDYIEEFWNGAAKNLLS